MVRDFGYTPDYFAASQHGRCPLSELAKRPVAGEGLPGASGLCIELGSIARGRNSLWEPCGRSGSVSGAGFGHRSQSRHSGRDCDARSSTLTNLTSQPDRASVRLNNSSGDVKPRRPVRTTNRYLKPDNVPAGRPTANWLPGGGEQAARNAFQGVGRRDDSRI